MFKVWGRLRYGVVWVTFQALGFGVVDYNFHFAAVEGLGFLGSRRRPPDPQTTHPSCALHGFRACVISEQI